MSSNDKRPAAALSISLRVVAAIWSIRISSALRTIGVTSIRAHVVRLGARLVEGAEARGLRISSPRDGSKRTGWVGIAIPDAERVVRELARRRVFVDHRPGCGLRVSPHFYTTDDDIDVFFTEFDALS